MTVIKLADSVKVYYRVTVLLENVPKDALTIGQDSVVTVKIEFIQLLSGLTVLTGEDINRCISLNLKFPCA